LDMVYNLGLEGLLKFKKLKAAVESGDWASAAAQSHRNGPSDDRNDWTSDMFLAAAK
jgi:GH24 family phage-related lysozyme (muramidase)